MNQNINRYSRTEIKTGVVKNGGWDVLTLLMLIIPEKLHKHKQRPVLR